MHFLKKKSVTKFFERNHIYEQMSIDMACSFISQSKMEVLMGEKDAVFKEYASDNRRFADLFNYFIYGGKQIIQPDELKPANIEHIVVMRHGEDEYVPLENALDLSETASMETESDENSKTDVNEKKDRKQGLITRFRDLFKFAVFKHDNENGYLFLGIEEQSKPSYKMPVRIMLYDAMAYMAQTDQNLHQSYSELSDISPNELVPVVSVVVYFGQTKWTAPRSLHDMMPRLSDALKPFIPNYTINLIEPLNMSEEDYKRMHTNWNAVFEAFKVYVDKGTNDYYNYVRRHTRMSDVDVADLNLLETMTGCRLPKENKQGEGKMNANVMMEEFFKKHDAAVIDAARTQIIENSLEDVARRMISLGMSMDDIELATQLSRERIEALCSGK